MEFTKMQGTGYDFIIINNIEAKIPVEKLGELAEKLCHRKFSIGADGLMVVDSPVFGGDLKMRYYNADGSFGEMCGNGARCLARFGYENGFAGEVQHIETIAGMVIGYRQSESMYRVRLNDVSVRKEMDVSACGNKYHCAYLELGDPGIPHAVVEMKGLKEMEREDLRDLGKALRKAPEFPKGANVNFYEIIGNDEVADITYERGAEDFTLSCGTGTGAVVTVLKERGMVSGDNVKVKVPGGELFVTVNEEGIFLTGPTEVIAEGYVNTKELL